MPVPAPASAPVQTCGLSAPPSDAIGFLPPEPPHPRTPTASAIATTRAIVVAHAAARITDELPSTPRTWGSLGRWQGYRLETARADTARSVHHEMPVSACSIA